MPPCLHKSFLSFNNHLPKLHLPPKNFNEKCSNRVVRKVSQGSNFEKRYIVNSSWTYLLACDSVKLRLCRFTNFSLIRQTATMIKLNSSFSIPQKIIIIIFDFCFFGEYVNLRLYSLDEAQAYQFRYFVSSCILNDDCISKKSKNVYQAPTSSARKKLWTMKCGAPKRFLMLSLKIILSWKKWY